ncbi:MAG TPA: SpoIIE family protein phosphatase [Pseudomonadota bacterium]|nr:SpoIIE family protein phosphatase [Pseudomonadota bacterium]
MRFRTAIALLISLVLAAALATTGVVISVVLERTARRELAAELARGRAVFADLLAYRRSLHRAESRLLADEPRLKAVVATDDVTPATMLGVVADLRRALRCDLLLLTDRSGRVLADAAHPEDVGQVLAANPVIAEALLRGESQGVWVDGAQVFQVHGRRLAYGSITMGAVVLGYRISDALAESVGQYLGAGVVIELDHQVIASSRLDGAPALAQGAAAASAMTAALAALPREPGPHQVQLGDARYLMTQAPLPGYSGEKSLHYAVFRSLDSALLPARRLVRSLLLITAAALVLALLAALWLARRLTRPVDKLVAFTQRIAAGELAPATLTGLREVQVLGAAMNQMAGELAASRIQIAERTRLAKELEIAERIQTSILPRELAVPGLQLCAQMVPASEVGGDYYDVLPLPDGCWLGIGDVAGHGLPAGLVMMMVQSGFAALLRARPTAPPRELVVLLNQLVFDNVRNRLATDEHVTFTALRYFTDGRLVFAGAHESILVLRAKSGQCELHDTPGTWLGVIPDIGHGTVDTTLQLAVGDVVILYSDGVTEAVSERKEQLGMSRLRLAIEQCAGRPASELHAHLMALVRSWSPKLADDVTLLVLRYEGDHGS